MKSFTGPPRPHAGSARPHLRMQKIKLAGRSAFPPTPRTAFQASGGGVPGPATAFSASVPGAAGPGETGE